MQDNVGQSKEVCSACFLSNLAFDALRVEAASASILAFVLEWLEPITVCHLWAVLYVLQTSSHFALAVFYLSPAVSLSKDSSAIKQAIHAPVMSLPPQDCTSGKSLHKQQ